MIPLFLLVFSEIRPLLAPRVSQAVASGHHAREPERERGKEYQEQDHHELP